MSSSSLGLPSRLFAEVFPFHIAVDRNLKIVQMGKVLERLYPELCVESQLERHFSPKFRAYSRGVVR